MNVLIVEDEENLAVEVQEYLSKEHFLCDIAYTGVEASEKLAVNYYDFVLLDLGLPDYEGMNLLQEAKKSNEDAAFIIITARNAVDDKVKGLNLGADDYLAKPFSLLELHSRMQAISRRKFGLKSSSSFIGKFQIDYTGRRLTFEEIEVSLTKKEFDLLNYLSLHKNRVLTRIQLIEHIWGNLMEEDFESNYIDVHIKNLRKKLSAFDDAEWLETVRGVGYRIRT